MKKKKKMENSVRLLILSMNVFNFILFFYSNSNSTISDLKYHSHKPLNFSEMKIVIPLITLLLIALAKVVFCTFIPSINVALFRILTISLAKLKTHFRPMFPLFTQRTHGQNKRVSAVFKRHRKGTLA